MFCFFFFSLLVICQKKIVNLSVNEKERGAAANTIHYGSIILSAAVNILKHRVGAGRYGRRSQTSIGGSDKQLG